MAQSRNVQVRLEHLLEGRQDLDQAIAAHRRQQPRTSAARPRIIDYSCLNTMERRLLQRRPVNVWSILSLRKPVMRRFLRANSQRYKTKDRKQRLMHLIMEVLRRTNPRRQAAREAIASGIVPVRAPGAPRAAPPENVRLGPGEHQRGHRCCCYVSLAALILNRPQLPNIYINHMKRLLSSTDAEIEFELRKYRVQPDEEGCRAQNLMAIRDLYENEYKEQIEVMRRQEVLFNESLGSVPIVCSCCLTARVQCAFKPCGHAVCCRMCSRKVNGHCPMCRVPFKSIISFRGGADTEEIKVSALGQNQGIPPP